MGRFSWRKHHDRLADPDGVDGAADVGEDGIALFGDDGDEQVALAGDQAEGFLGWNP